MRTQNIKGKLLSNHIATRNTNEKKAGQVELARKRVTNFRVLFSASRARVQGPLGWYQNQCILYKTASTQHSLWLIDNIVTLYKTTSTQHSLWFIDNIVTLDKTASTQHSLQSINNIVTLKSLFVTDFKVFSFLINISLQFAPTQSLTR